MTIIESTAYDIDLRANSLPRTPGLHLSGILKRMAINQGLFDEAPDELDLDRLIHNTQPHAVGRTASLMRLVVGFAWEEYRASRIPDLLYQPGELTLDGIVGTPDGIRPETHGMVLHEFKATWMSVNKPLDQGTKLYWLWQCMGYLAMMSAWLKEKCVRAVLHPLYVNGDYRDWESRCQYRPVEIEFTWEEIMTNWQCVLVNRDAKGVKHEQ